MDNLVTIYKDTILYRAAKTFEYYPKCRECKDTGKIGVYFSFNHPQLSEMMTVEYNENLIISVYKLTQDIKVFEGKYTYRNHNYCNISHVDFEIIPITSFNKNYKFDSFELFLTEEDLKYIEIVDKYEFSVEDCIKKYRLYETENLIW